MLTGIESDILRYCAESHDCPELVRQVQDAQAGAREHTGVGLYTKLTLPHRGSLAPIQPRRSPIIGPTIESPSLEFGASSLVWCDDDGYIDCIEIAAFGNHYPDSEFEYSLSAGLNSSN